VDMQAVNRRVIESLIRCGAMDELKGTRSQKMAILDAAIETGLRAARDRNSGQSALFGDLFGGPEERSEEGELPAVPDWDAPQKLTGEKELLGFYVTGHPLDQYKDKLSELGTHTTATLEGVERGVEVKLCGLLTGIQRKRNQKQELWASMQLEDLQGTVDAMVFATKFKELGKELEEDKAVMVTAKILVDEGSAPRLSIQDLVALDNARVKLPAMLQLRVRLSGEDDPRAAELAALLGRKPGPASVRLVLEKPRDFSLTLDLAQKVRADKEMKAELARLFGSTSFEASGEA
jgi:DNA polymerase-3 subunit alpha